MLIRGTPASVGVVSTGSPPDEMSTEKESFSMPPGGFSAMAWAIAAFGSVPSFVSSPLSPFEPVRRFRKVRSPPEVSEAMSTRTKT